MKLDKKCLSLKGRILPQLERQLYQAAEQTEGFLLFGVPPKQYIKETWTELAKTRDGPVSLSPDRHAQ